MTAQEFSELVAFGEQPGVEFKNARARKDKNFCEVVRAVLGMANRRDGGLILVGVENDGNVTGLTASQQDSWTIADHVRQAIAPYADPHAYVDVEMVTTSSEQGAHTCAVIRVQEFDEVPVLCAKSAKDANGQEVLRVGACYVRSRQMPATTEVSDHAAFRELLDLAVDKGVRAFVRRSRAAGLEVDGVSDSSKFQAQRAGVFDE